MTEPQGEARSDEEQPSEELVIMQSTDDGGVRLIGYVDPSQLKLDPDNANLGTERGNWQLEESLSKYGAGRSILLDRNNVDIAGNKTLEKAVEKGMKIAIVETDGHTLIAVRRRDLDLMTDPAARELATADNRISELNLNWDYGKLTEMFKTDGIDVWFMFTEIEQEDIMRHVEVPTIAELETQYGELKSEDFYNVFKLMLPQEMIDRYNALVEGIQGDDRARFAACLAWAEAGAQAAPEAQAGEQPAPDEVAE